jgi:2-polyprenyl-3-methyl-5-hydroxy-6-metoxy-1,4-benzoquinol methylase
MYADEYFDDAGAWVCGYWKGSYVSNERKLRQEARETLALLPRTSGKLLEIGSAGGFFLDEARMAGFDVTGIELNERMAEWGRSTLGLEILAGIFEKLEFEASSFDVIVAQDVLEHVRDPRKFVSKVSGLLAPGGLFFVRGPLEQSLRESFYLGSRRLLRRSPLMRQEAPYHLQGFARQSFRTVVERSGLQLLHFKATSNRPHRDFSSIKTAVATIIETTTHAGDRLTGRGDFMTAYASRPKSGHS